MQVLQEFYIQATRQGRADAITHEQAVGLIQAWCRFPIQETTVGVMTAALATRRRFGVSYWDAAVIEAGRALGCAVVLSEDLSPETDYDGVRVENPLADRSPRPRGSSRRRRSCTASRSSRNTRDVARTGVPHPATGFQVDDLGLRGENLGETRRPVGGCRRTIATGPAGGSDTLRAVATGEGG